jgi:hypothetical protein
MSQHSFQMAWGLVVLASSFCTGDVTYTYAFGCTTVVDLSSEINLVSPEILADRTGDPISDDLTSIVMAAPFSCASVFDNKRYSSRHADPSKTTINFVPAVKGWNNQPIKETVVSQTCCDGGCKGCFDPYMQTKMKCIYKFWDASIDRVIQKGICDYCVQVNCQKECDNGMVTPSVFWFNGCNSCSN